MSASETMELLQLARDAWDSGRLSESWRLMAMVEVDCEYKRRTARPVRRTGWLFEPGWHRVRMAQDHWMNAARMLEWQEESGWRGLFQNPFGTRLRTFANFGVSSPPAHTPGGP